MKKFFTRFTVFLLVLLATLALGWVVVVSLFQEQVGQKIVAAVNKQLTSELSVQRFELSAIRSLPSISASLRGVVLKDNRGGILLEASELSFHLSLLSLFGPSLDLKSVVVRDGTLRIYIDRRGRGNYDIFRETETPTERTETRIDLETAQLRNLTISYEDQSTAQRVEALVRNATFKGQFSNREFALNSEAELLTGFVQMDSTRYLIGQNIGYNADVAVNLDRGVYTLQKMDLRLGKNLFETKGSVETWEKGPYFNLLFTCKKGDLSSLIALLPSQYLGLLGDFSSRGDFAFEATVKGQLRADLRPEVRAEVHLDKGRIESPRMKEPLKDVSFTARFTNGKFRTDDSSVFAIENLQGYFQQKRFAMRLRVEDLDNPQIDFQADGVVPMKALYGLFNNDQITDGSGAIVIKNLLLKGRYEDMLSPRGMTRVGALGEMTFEAAALVINGEEMRMDRGQLLLNGDTLRVSELQLSGAGSDIRFRGQVIDLIPVLFADSTNSERVELLFQAELESEQLDLDRLSQLSALTAAEQAADTLVVDSLQEERIVRREQFTQFLRGSFQARVRQFRYGRIEGNDFVGQLEFKNNELIIRGKTRAMRGGFDLDGAIYFAKAPRLVARLVCTDINATEFFRQTDNFGQTVLTDRNVSGTMDTKMAIYAYWNEQGVFQYDRLRVLAGVGIREGRLHDFAMLEQFSTYVKMRDLMDLRFANLENYIEINGNTVYLPIMFIQSNAMNLTVSGEHTFDNDINYSMKINAAQVVANRFRNGGNQLQPARRGGWFNLYFNIAGDIDDYKVKAARKEVERDFLFSQRRKDIVRRALEREFGSIQLIQEPREMQDAADKEVYLDMEITGGQQN